MKKRLSIALLVMLAAALCLLAGCSERIPQTADGFRQIMEDASFTVEGIADLDREEISLITSLKADCEKYQIRFNEWEDVESAEEVYTNMQKNLEEQWREKMLGTKIATNRYEYYAFNSGEMFYLIARIDATIVSCTANKEYRSEILDLVETLGYR